MSSLTAPIESLLFVANKPLTFKRLSQLLNVSQEAIVDALKELVKQYEERGAGITFMQDQEKVQLVTSKEQSELIAKFVKEEQNKELTQPALETLTIVAYRGPVTKAEIETIRGINCSLILRNLLIRGLVEEIPGKDIFDMKYHITFEFTRWLGIRKVGELPHYKELNSNEYLQTMLAKK
ncbi:MAG: SMC-Scp complex subunit ScpB [Candidatus Kerfeldbacteria bacterium RIFCSPHIGHO2_02_FULL_42_14]|uniref:SMC-Scp complex subunit ScpB n=1 Tax=Candidatus Kerfeldbacteria bacterium RIFCSPHIGHO2_02_FULL_42_14 TaxID=1798540 RepID=A0A1G2ART4_9BACT|nr:MAG: SMC-Scp complex subunit ScpB [Candidatus Kerfeldbacteria bacterium RIFCSPHIGHO2_02_FULL_42_14]OGY80387.1 MAG: SMC-Scp complex subunit ScpB [Candidatus Kerfeldbacteria bacterium RIFCSPHIGHO2_12_FULL_42_13]OGY83816.1 MAG: SMC-Scp complex subunit ScpB [Candidatus Kerfeldbacteria bacterium RIFCSPLOWO2_02_FULL_42_19]